ncbi:MAG: TonB-dependent receptor [Dysgonamonadaceae bacterium]|jgi:outer membrane receptor protein involved in Fe transport/rhodanese-related sulfurtransferase|nr:TonB-dependent receptor [Dysgonamonadaceae bacterium]
MKLTIISINIITAIVRFFTSSAEIHNLNPDEFEEKLNIFGTEQLIDVSYPREFKENHISGAININFRDSDFREQIAALALDKDKPIFLYCGHGVRSKLSANRIRKMGFTTIFDLDKGLHSWMEVGKPTNSTNNEEKDQIEKNMELKKTLLLGFTAACLTLTAQETENVINLEEVIVTAQGREERMLVVPITMNSLSGNFLETTNTTDLTQLSNFVPGLNVRIQTPYRPTFVIRGLTSDEVSPTAQPRVSTYFNNAPISRASMAKSNLFDMERVEVVKGPQGTLFGRGSQIGGINFITRKPASDFGGYVGLGVGNYGMTEVQGVINVPVIDNKLMFRMGGSHQYRDGYVENLSSNKNLGGINSTDLRFSARYLPMNNFRIDLIVDYQNDKDNGTPFMSKRFPNSEGVTNIFDFKASFDEGTKFFNHRELLGTMLDMNYRINDRNSITSLTSFHHNFADARWDGDGTQAPAIDFAESVKVNQFTQEFRWNFTQDRLNGFIGTSFWREDVSQKYQFNPDERYLMWLMMDAFGVTGDAFGMPGKMGNNMILPNGTPNPMQDMMVAGMLMGMGLPEQMVGMIPPLSARSELKETSAINSAFDLFVNFDFSITDRLIFNVGARAIWDKLSIADMVNPVDGSPASTIGFLTQVMQGGMPNPNNPNFLFAVSPLVEESKNYFAATYRTSLKYLINNNATVFGGFSTGRRPAVLQPTITGDIVEAAPETVNSFDIGFKYFERGHFSFDAGLFYQTYRDFQATTFDNFYTILPVSKATSYGAEFNKSVTLCRHLDVFGNYAFIHARFNDNVVMPGTDPTTGQPIEVTYKLKDNHFRLTPDHSFTFGLNARARLSRNIGMVFTPTYTYKSKIYFEDNNDPDLTQAGHGLLNLNLGFNFIQQRINVSLFANNVTNEKYIISAGNTGLMFHAPTFVPGIPTTFGVRARWSF